MRKVLGCTLAIVLTLTLSAVAGEVIGTVKSVDPADRSIVLDNGTRLTVSESQISGLAAGDNVRAVYQMDGGRNIVSDIDHHTVGTDARWTLGYGSGMGTPIDTLQAD
jgi:L-cysteine desulfidase